MGEYEDRYPDAYGRGETVEAEAPQQETLGPPRQVRPEPQPSAAPAAETRPDAVAEPSPAAAPPQAAAPVPVRRDDARAPLEICEEIRQRLAENPFIDASGITVSADASEVLLEGTINSRIALSMALSIVEHTPGVGRVELRLTVLPPARDRVPAG